MPSRKKSESRRAATTKARATKPSVAAKRGATRAAAPKRAPGRTPRRAPASPQSELATLRREVERLADLEACRRLRVTYFRCLDTANLRDLKEILTEDFSCVCHGGDYVYRANGRAEFLAMTENSFHTEIVTQHNGHGAEVDFAAPGRATALVYFNDLVYHFRSKEFLMGTGLYRDRYRKDPDGVWRIEFGEYERIYEVTEILDRAPHFTAHYLAKHGKQLAQTARYDATTGRYV